MKKKKLNIRISNIHKSKKNYKKYMINLINNDQLLIIKNNYNTFDIIKHIHKNKINSFLFIKINSINKDLNTYITINSSIELINKKNIKSLDVLRHSCAHLLAHALTNIYPNIKLNIGPVIKNGFYYDFFYQEKLSINDLFIIENEMKKIIKQSVYIKRFLIKKEYALNFFNNNKYKIDLLTNIISDHNVSIYKQDSFIDLCRGPHILNTKYLKYFKLIKISGAYWKNNNKKEMLYRIYGTIWNNKINLFNYISKINLLKNSDHRILGKKLMLYDFYDHSPGVVFWNKLGWKIFIFIKKYISNILKEMNYYEVNTPIMNGDFLFNKSGHIEKYSQNMFIYNNINLLKPMSCPCHINIFNNFYKKSYKNLPFRISEFGSCFRKELSGTLHGLMRLKNFTQDDGHIFCTDYQIKTEIINFIHSLKKVYYKFGFSKIKVVLSKKPDNIQNDLNIWNMAEKILEKVIKELKINYEISHDGAFYGPKLEFSLRDKFERLWQCGTIQVDFFTSVKLNSKYIDYDGILKSPIILHRAIFGSIERFIGVLLENNDGFLPFFISPLQFLIIYVSVSYLFYAKNIFNILKNKYNIEIYFSNERLEYKLKQAIIQKIPYTIIVGKNEYINKLVTLRDNKTNKVINIALKDFLEKIKNF